MSWRMRVLQGVAWCLGLRIVLQPPPLVLSPLDIAEFLQELDEMEAGLLGHDRRPRLQASKAIH
jgi:hypothetical protein